MGSFLLAVNQGDSLLFQERCQENQGNLGGICPMEKHRFPEKHPADADAVGTADQDTVVKDFSGMGDAPMMQFPVIFENGVRNPGAVLSLADRGGATAHDILESGIETDPPDTIRMHAPVHLPEFLPKRL